MAERLTEKDSIDNKRYMLNSEENQKTLTNAKLNNGFRKAYYWGKALDKLAQLEDVMEDYNIKTVEELGKRLEDVEQYNYETNHQFIDVMAKYGIESIEELDKKLSDGITWQKACELACEKIVDMLGDCPIETVNWQQEDDWCEENCDKHEKLLCWDRYFYQQAKRGWNINK